MSFSEIEQHCEIVQFYLNQLKKRIEKNLASLAGKKCLIDVIIPPTKCLNRTSQQRRSAHPFCNEKLRH